MRLTVTTMNVHPRDRTSSIWKGHFFHLEWKISSTYVGRYLFFSYFYIEVLPFRMEDFFHLRWKIFVFFLFLHHNNKGSNYA